MGKSIEVIEHVERAKNGKDHGGAYAYSYWLASKYGLSKAVAERISSCIMYDVEKSRYMEQTISYLVFALTSEGRKDYEISAAIEVLLRKDKCPTVAEIESLLSICVSAGNSIYEVINTPYLYDGRFTSELLYAELQIMGKGRDKVDLKNLMRLNRKLNDKQREGLMKLYPLSSKTKFMAYANLRMQEKERKVDVKNKVHYI